MGGLPTPAAASVIASFALFTYTLRNEMNHATFAGFDIWLQRLVPLLAVALGLLMVSRIPYPHVVTQLLRGQKSFPQVVAIVFIWMSPEKSVIAGAVSPITSSQKRTFKHVRLASLRRTGPRQACRR